MQRPDIGPRHLLVFLTGSNRGPRHYSSTTFPQLSKLRVQLEDRGQFVQFEIFGRLRSLRSAQKLSVSSQKKSDQFHRLAGVRRKA